MEWPLFISEPSIADAARHYYPDLTVLESSVLPKWVVTCEPQILFQRRVPQFKGKTLWLPHGNSDKGWKIPIFDALGTDEPLLIYGQQMRQRCQERPHAIIGNFRKQYYEMHRPFYRQLTRAELPIDDIAPVLYAPTWVDPEGNGTFWSDVKSVLQTIPTQTTLWIRPHPNMVKTDEHRLLALTGPLKARLLPEFPPVYPVLEYATAYIGDMSSVGYDFLAFDRPLFFPRQAALPLHQAITSIERKALYAEAFAEVSVHTMRDRICALVE
jgi:hypothetical protein